MTSSTPSAGTHFNADPVQAIDAAMGDLCAHVKALARDLNESSGKNLTLNVHFGEVASFLRLARHQPAPDAPVWPLVIEMTRRDILDGRHEISIDTLGALPTTGSLGAERPVESSATYTLPTYKTMYAAVEASVLSKLTETELTALQAYKANKAGPAPAAGQP